MSSSSLVPKTGHEDVAVVDLGHLLGQRLLGDRDPLGQRRPLEALAVDDVEEQPEDHPAAADQAGGVVEDEDADEGEAAEDRREDRRQRQLAPRARGCSSGIRKGRGRSGSVTRRRMIERWAIVIARVAPKA